jgi:CRISPR-associated endonuclease/helicase Cas3
MRLVREESRCLAGSAEAFAHTRPGRPAEEWEPLDSHLGKVADLAATFASTFGAGEWGRLAGLWHDLGKYRGSFQRYLRKAEGVDQAGSSEECAPGRVDHSTVGAIHAVDSLGEAGRAVAYVIAGHHAGLPDAVGGDASLLSRLDRREVLVDWQRDAIPHAILQAPPPKTGPPSRDPQDLHLWLRMLFSCLTDADFLATEAFMDAERAADRRRGDPAIATLAARLDVWLAEHFPDPATEVARIRADVLRACTAGAAQEPGLFTLTVPTGGGKTLSSLAFALNHAKAWGKRRVIYAIPYTSIIEQTADVFRNIFGDSVIEHHSNLDTDDPARDSLSRRLAAENWDAPIIVTTNVQLFESLFAARGSRCRKLHNVVNSVVVLDEAQLLPPEFLDPIRHCIRGLTRDYGVSLVLSTATQPALDLGGARELAPDPPGLDRRLRRVRYEWPSSSTATAWEQLAAAIARERQILCVVSRRDDARELFDLIRGEEGAVHLSALMCGAHRSQAIGRIRERLAAGSPVRLVSTQLVEAGVDLDFPVVYRAFAGLDSIAQAAGRCNREGRLPGLGRVVIFNAPTPPPPGLLRKAESKAREVLAGHQGDHIDLTLFSKYFDLLYKQGVNSLDRHDILGLLGRDARRMAIQFRAAAERFRLVDESGYYPVVVGWGRGAALIQLLQLHGPERRGMRLLQRFTVSVPARQLRKLQTAGDVEEVLPGLFVAKPGLYDEETGLRTDGREYGPGELIC